MNFKYMSDHFNQVEAHIKLGELLENNPYLIADLEVEKLVVLAHHKIIISHIMKDLVNTLSRRYIVADDYIIPEVSYGDVCRTDLELMRFSRLLRRYYAY